MSKSQCPLRTTSVRISLLVALLLTGAVLSQPISTFPYVQDFDAFMTCGTSAGTACVLSAGWTNLPGDDADWTVDSGGTSSTATGPAGDAPAHGGGNYLYFEASNPAAAGWQILLQSPDFDTTMAPGAGFTFWYHMYGADIGELRAETWDPMTMMYTTVFTMSGQQQTSSPDPWLQTGVLPLPTGVTHVRILGSKAGTSFNGDMAIDLFEVADFSAPNSAPISLDTPMTGCMLTAAETVTITVENLSTVASAAFPVSFEIVGAFPQGPFAEMMPPIPASSTAQYVFTATADLSMAGTYDFVVTTALPGDVDPSNDILMTSVLSGGSIPGLVLPIHEDWEAGMGAWTLTGTASWELGTPGDLVIIGTPGGVGVNSWMTGLTGPYASNENGAVQSPGFSMCGFTQPEVSLDVWWNSEFSWDGAVMQVSYDSATTWQNVGAFGDPNNWYNDNSISGNPGGQQEGWTGRDSSGNGSGGWVRASSTDLLPGVAMLRVAFGSDGSVTDDGFAFDNLLIREAGLLTNLDVGAFQPMQPVMASNNDTGVVVMAAQITPDVGDDLLRGFDLIASGVGDDATDILNVSVVLEDAATVNGVVDGMDTVIFTGGTYPADDGTINVALSPGAGLIRLAGGTNSLLVLYDLSGTASGMMPPTDYTVTMDNILVAGDVMLPAGVPPSGTVSVDACPTTLCGDCNMDMMVNILDALNGAQHAAGLITLTGEAFSNCNVQGLVEPDPMAQVDVLDALNIAQNAAGLPVLLTCC